MRKVTSAPVGAPRSRKLITYSRHGLLEGDRQLALVKCTIHREELVCHLINLLCAARATDSRGLEPRFQAAKEVLDKLREANCKVIGAVKHWQQAFVETPPFQFGKHSNYLTHMVVSLNFVDKFRKFRKFLNVTCSRNPFAIPNGRPQGDIRRWERFFQYHQFLINQEKLYGLAEVPELKVVDTFLKSRKERAKGSVLQKQHDAATSVEALQRQKKANEKLLKRIAEKELQVRKFREEAGQRRAEMREETALRTQLRGEILQEEEAEEAQKALIIEVERKRKNKEQRMARQKEQERRKSIAQKRAAKQLKQQEMKQIHEEAEEMHQARLRKTAKLAKQEAVKISHERQAVRREKMQRFAEQAQKDRLDQEKLQAKLNNIKGKRTQKILKKVEARQHERILSMKEARFAREQEKARKILEETKRVSRAAFSSNGLNKLSRASIKKKKSRIASYAQSLNKLSKRQAALSAAERQLAAAKKRYDICSANGDEEGIRKAELMFCNLQETVENNRRLAKEIENKLREWSGSLKPLMSINSTLESSIQPPQEKATKGKGGRKNNRLENRSRSHKQKKNVLKNQKMTDTKMNIASLLLGDEESSEIESHIPSLPKKAVDDDPKSAIDEQEPNTNLLEAATEWEAAYSSMLITPHMRAKIREKNNALAPQKTEIQQKKGNINQSTLSQQDLVHIGMEVALNLPLLNGQNNHQQSQNIPFTEVSHTVKPMQPTVSAKDKMQWQHTYEKTMMLPQQTIQESETKNVIN